MKKNFFKYLAFLLPACFAVACGNGGKSTLVTTIDGFTQGTGYHIVYKSQDTLDLQSGIDSMLQVIDNSMSIYNPNSLISRLNRNETDTLDAYIAYCINTARKVSELSDGMYDITVTPLVEAWGFATREGDEHPNLDSLVQIVGFDKISIQDGRLVKGDPRVRINLNSIAKGYSADIIAGFIESFGVKEYLVEIGGEIAAKGTNPSGTPWVVGVDKPIDGNYVPGAQTQTMFSITGKGIATSGNYRNFRYDAEGNKIVHTINPKTGASTANSLLSVTVVAENCALADAMGTALLVLGLDEAVKLLESQPDIWGYLVYDDGKGGYGIYMSPEIKERIIE